MKRIIASELERRDALLGWHLAKRELRRVKRAWRCTERIHASVLDRLRMVDAREAAASGATESSLALQLEEREHELRQEKALHRAEREKAQSQLAALLAARTAEQQKLKALRAELGALGGEELKADDV